MSARLRQLVSFAALSLLGFISVAQAQVNASLTAADSAIVPGQPFSGALRLEHQAHWHTYWINAGTGYPTSIEWKLPEGWTAGDIQWPTPIPIRDSHGDITGNGYEEVVYLTFTLTPPPDLVPGTTVTLNAHADWLMCADVCIPGDQALTLTLPVVASEAPTDPTHGTAIRDTLATLPILPTGITVTAEKRGTTARLTVSGFTGGAPTTPWFFAEDAYILYDEPQTLVSSTASTLTIDLPISDYSDSSGERLVGVLRQDGSWTTGSSPLAGLAINVPFGAASTLSMAAPAVAAEDAKPLIWTLAIALIGGLILNLMPCVFPVLGIKIMGFVNQAGADRKRVALHGWVFSLGVLASFWSLAGLLAILRAGGDQLGWGFQLQSAPFVFVLAAIMLVFAMAMSGVFEFGMSATGVGSKLQSKDGLTGSFFTGVLATVVATPCSAPFLAPALGAALALPLISSFAVFTAIAVGLSLPYLLLSIFPGAIKVLPRPGAWMETFKQAMAFPLYATVGYLIWVLAGQTSEGGSLNAILGLTVIALAVWIYGRYATFAAKPARKRFGIFGGLIVLLAGTAMGWPQSPAPTDIVWEKWAPAAIAAAQAEGRPVYVDFTARWCATCQANKKYVFGSDEVKAYFRDKKIVTLKADWTKQDPAITKELARWNRSAVPFNLIYLPGQPEPTILPELLTPGIVLDALK
jgi:thiol:disulfide interchange protein/DsbC/DsbD-like thiol-disulfide interchange protein